MTAEATNDGSIYQGDFDTWTFTATQGDYIALSVGTVTQTTAHFGLWIRLVASTGASLGNSFTQTGASNIAATAPTSGTYTVIIGSYLSGFYDGTASYLVAHAHDRITVKVRSRASADALTHNDTIASRNRRMAYAT